jgi:hypothetical protein
MSRNRRARARGAAGAALRRRRRRRHVVVDRFSAFSAVRFVCRICVYVCPKRYY